jgi:hypothetical protein
MNLYLLRRIIFLLQRLFDHEDLAKYLFECKFKVLTVLADDGVTYGFTVNKFRDIFKRTNLVYHWNFVCEENRFKDGDVLCFKFDKARRCHIYKVDN